MSLLDRIVKSSIAENDTNRRLHDMSYSAINGDRQEPQQQPEGVVMLGQLSREKPMTVITKQMIQDYQQQENELNTAPNIINGVPMKYKPVGYDLTLKPVKDTKVLVEDTQELIGDRVYVSGDIQRLGQAIKDTSENIKKIKNDIDEKGSNFGNLRVLNQEITKFETLQKQLKEKNKLYDYIEETLKANETKKKDIDRENAITAQDNQAILSVYERELNQSNRNRLNLQQQPNESEAEYYQRLKELQTEKYDPALYRQRAITQNTTELKGKLGNLFKDTSFKEEILKTLSDEDKFLLNKNFDKVGGAFLDEYGFNNKTLNSKMASKDLSNKIKLLQGNALATLQSAFKRNRQADIYRDSILLERDKQVSLARRAEEDLIRDRFKREQEQGRRRDDRIQGRQLLERTLLKGQEQIEPLKNLQAVINRSNQQRLYNQGLTEFVRPTSKLQGAIRQAKQRGEYEKLKQASSAIKGAMKREQQQELYKDALLDKRDLEDLEVAKAIDKVQKTANIQRAFRGHLGRKEFEKRLEEKDIQDFERAKAEELARRGIEKQASSLLQGAYRNHLAKIELTNRQDEAYNKKVAAKNIQRVFRGSIGRRQFEKEQENQARERVREAFKDDNRSSAGDTTLSGLTTPAISRAPSVVGKIRKQRSDKGVKRGQYNYDPDIPVGRPKKPRNPVGRPRKINEEGAKEGQGIRKSIYKRKPQIDKNEKMKNRLRLVASQVEAGNNNPRLIGEVNTLYKKLYNVDNAYQYLQKNKK